MAASKREYSEATKNELLEVALLTRMIREHQKQIEDISLRRSKILFKLQDKNNHPTRPEKITYEVMAEAAGVGTQAIYKMLKMGPGAKAQPGRARKFTPDHPRRKGVEDTPEE